MPKQCCDDPVLVPTEFGYECQTCGADIDDDDEE